MLQMQGMSRVKITSRDNPRLKLARKIRDGQDEGSIFVEGLRLSEEAVRSSIKIEFCIISSDFGLDGRGQFILSSLATNRIEIIELDDRNYSTVADTQSSQGIILICERPISTRDSFECRVELHESKLDLVVMLYEINNPSNLGAIFRAAEAAGAKGIIVSKRSADCFSPKSLRAAMGSAFRSPVWSEADLHDVLDFAKRFSYSTAAVAANSRSAYTEMDWRARRLLIFGSEAHGLPVEAIDAVNESVGIPMESSVESLNLAVAAGIILFEARRQVSNE
jgi:RNA methyltransferase, TrmH family